MLGRSDERLLRRQLLLSSVLAVAALREGHHGRLDALSGFGP
jgi:hypothetical protein